MDTNDYAKTCRGNSKATDEEIDLAIKYVMRHIKDPTDRVDILLALGLMHPDFQWVTLPASKKRIKVTLDGQPYPH